MIPKEEFWTFGLQIQVYSTAFKTTKNTNHNKSHFNNTNQHEQ